jgi:hypothetical protein
MARRFNRKPLTDEARDARRKADRDRIEQAARALLTSDGWQRWIRLRASNGLSRYSLVIWGRGCRGRVFAGLRRRRHVADSGSAAVGVALLAVGDRELRPEAGVLVAKALVLGAQRFDASAQRRLGRALPRGNLVGPGRRAVAQPLDLGAQRGEYRSRWVALGDRRRRLPSQRSSPASSRASCTEPEWVVDGGSRHTG